MSAALASARRHAGTLAFFAVGFVVLPLSVVSWRGGGNLETRFQQWNQLHQSIQSRDWAREAIDDAEADTTLIESFLLPSDGRRARARAFYEKWRANRDWWTTESHVDSIERNARGTSAVVTHEVELKLWRAGRERKRHKVRRRESWEKADGVWYLRDTRDRVLEVLAPRRLGFLKPGASSAREAKHGSGGGAERVRRGKPSPRIE